MKKIFIIHKNYYSNNKSLIVSYIFMAILIQVTVIIMPLVVAKIIDSAIYFSKMDSFIKYVVIGATIQVIAIIVTPLSSYIVSIIGIDATIQLKKKIIKKISYLNYELINKITVGYLIQLMENDSENTQSLVISDLVDFVCKAIYFTSVLVIIFKLHFILSLLMICVIPILLYGSIIMIPKIQKCTQEYIIKSEQVKNITDEIFGGVLVIKLANSYVFINNKIYTVLAELKKISLKYVKLTVIHSYLLTSGILSISNLIIIVLSAYLVIKGFITVGTITALLTYFTGLWGTYNYFINFWRNYKVKMVSVDRIINYLNLPIEQSEGKVAEEFSKLEMHGVTYSINGQNILYDISFHINNGDKILLTGDNGSGKSTLVQLVSGLITQSSGRIFYNGKEISEYNLHSLRDRICYIPAEPYIFSGSLEDNFFGKNSNNELIKKEKYSNILKNGGNLSSGEKKRLQLACGILQNSNIFILDEPLNFVDEVSKKEIIETIKKDFYDKTLIIISHDSEPFHFCTKKYFMINGKLQESE